MGWTKHNKLYQDLKFALNSPFAQFAHPVHMYQKKSGRWITVMLTIHGAKKSIVKNAYAQLSYAHYRILNLT